MINVKYHTNGFTVHGHALFANPGNDIVCSAVSVTTISVINEIERYISKKHININIDQNEGLIEFNICSQPLEAEILLNYFKHTMDDLALNYSKYIKIIN